MRPWTIEQALDLIRLLQGDVRKQFGFHICLGGGVLNRGESRKDLDLYFLSMDNNPVQPQWEKLLKWLNVIWAEGRDMTFSEDGDAHYAIPEGSPYKAKWSFIYGGDQRIDAFIL